MTFPTECRLSRRSIGSKPFVLDIPRFSRPFDIDQNLIFFFFPTLRSDYNRLSYDPSPYRPRHDEIRLRDCCRRILFSYFFHSISQERIGSAVSSSDKNPVFIFSTPLVLFLLTIVFLVFAVIFLYDFCPIRY